MPIIAGLLLGGFYAAVTVGISISFGILDIVNIAHPAFIILGSYIAYILNQRRSGSIRSWPAIVVLPVFYALGAAVYQVYYAVVRKARPGRAARARVFLRPVVRHRSAADPGVRRRLSLRRRRPISARRWHLGVHGPPAAHAGALRDLAADVRRCCSSICRATFTGRAIMAVSQDQLALQLMAADPIQIKRIAFAISIATASIAGALLIVIQPVEPSVGREYIGRVFAICVLGGLASLPGTVIAAMLLGVVESITATFYGPSWAPAVSFGFLLADAGVPAGRDCSDDRPCDVRSLSSISQHRWSARLFFAFARWLGNDYLFFAGYTVLQFIVLATAWNILGGYCGYVNFGSAAFFAVGAYSTVALHKLAAGVDRYFRVLAGIAADPAAERPDAHHHRRHRVGPDRARHGLSDAAACAARSSPSRRSRSPSCCRR